MATFKRCDRCPKEIECVKILGIEMSPIMYIFKSTGIENLELCEECFESFKEWLHASSSS